MTADYPDAYSLETTTTSVYWSTPPPPYRQTTCNSLEELSTQLKSLLSLVKTHKNPCICPILEPADKGVVRLSFTVRSSVCFNSSHRLDVQSVPPFSSIHVSNKGKRKFKSSSECLYEGWSPSLNQPIDIAIARFPSLFTCNSALQDAFISAGLHHENVCEVSAVFLYPAGETGVKIRVEREITRRSLEMDLLERQQLKSFYAEVVLMNILGQMCAVLLFAEKHVSNT